MDISGVSPIQAPVKTEWRENVNEVAHKEVKDTSFGSKLNQLSGVTTEKNLYQEGKNALSKDAYLKMMMEQMKNQDPFNPMKSDQFTQNIAMMSQLEQQVNMNKNLEKIISQSNNMQIAALQLVGKNVLADKSAIFHEQDKISQLQFKLPQDAMEVTLQIEDGSGQAIRSIPIGTQSQGEVKAKWDGFLDTGMPAPSGRYSFKVIAKAMDNTDMTISMKSEGKVTGVTSVKGTTFLLVGDQRVALNDVETIKEGTTETQIVQAPKVTSPAPAAINISEEVASDLADSESADEGGHQNLDKANLNKLMPIFFR
jgi:flagellar basal-body rod modification protein FlgD